MFEKMTAAEKWNLINALTSAVECFHNPGENAEKWIRPLIDEIYEREHQLLNSLRKVKITRMTNGMARIHGGTRWQVEKAMEGLHGYRFGDGANLVFGEIENTRDEWSAPFHLYEGYANDFTLVQLQSRVDNIVGLQKR